MLLLSRKLGEKIIIAEPSIVVTVLEVRSDRVRLGITAPDEVRVQRQEVWARLPTDVAGTPSLEPQ